MQKLVLQDNWEMRQVGTALYIKATVPGSVYGDLLANGCMENPFWKDNEDQALKLMDEDYEYRLLFDVNEELLNSDSLILRFDGLDTIADVVFNDHVLGSANNMHRVWEYEVKEYVKEERNELVVLFHSPTKYIKQAFEKQPTKGTEDAMDGFVHIRKAHCMFGWDWGAHLPDAGIWREVTLLGVNKARIDSVEVVQQHEEGKVTLRLSPSLLYAIEEEKQKLEHELTYMYVIKAPNGEETTYLEGEIIIEKPMLWWPNGLGEQNLYTITVLLMDGNEKIIDSWQRRIGLRTIRMDRSKDLWGEKFATCVNGKNIFAMGADYIPEDHLLGRVTKETTRALLEKAVFANFNSIRVWGGGYYPDDWFYDLCDEMGLIVWQDFMFACGVYDLTPEFEENITAEFIDNIKRLRHHASLGLMCGNNEMEQFVAERNWVTKDSEVRDYIIMYERILPRIMKEYAPLVTYWPASPSSGGSFDNPQDENRGDVHYWEVWHGNKPFSEYRKYHFRYLSEFGFQSFPAKKTIETFTDDERDMNIFSYIMEKHQRNGSANGKIMNYMQQTYRYPSKFETVIYASQLLQADAIRYGVEHFRRNRNDDRCMGAVYWQFNDCWPVASWSSVDYCQRLKALHYYAKRFFAPVMISCEEEGMMTSGQELVRLPFEVKKSIRLNVANETLLDKKILVAWQLRNAKAQVLRREEIKMDVPSLSTVWLDKVELAEADLYDHYVSFQAYELEEADKDYENLSKERTPVSEGTVIFSYPKYYRYENPKLTYEIMGNQITISASAYAKSVEIQNEAEDLILSDNYFDLNGGSKTVEVIRGDVSGPLHLRSVYDIG